MLYADLKYRTRVSTFVNKGLMEGFDKLALLINSKIGLWTKP